MPDKVQKSTAEAPLGIFQATCDPKGRVKLPTEFSGFLRAQDVDKVFITTLDVRVARIYPKKVWESNQNLFESAGEDAEIAEDVAFVANLYGGYADLDDQGRVLVPTELRRKLEIEAQPVWLDYYNGRINVFGKKIYDERMQRAMANLSEKVKLLEKKGLK